MNRLIPKKLGSTISSRFLLKSRIYDLISIPPSKFCPIPISAKKSDHDPSEEFLSVYFKGGSNFLRASNFLEGFLGLILIGTCFIFLPTTT